LANPTTNYSWVLPTPTDLVTDLPADFDVALQGVDTTLKALNPSTTLGDIEYRSATANTNTRLGIGTTNQVLTVVGGVPSWATATAGGMTLISTVNASGATGVSFTSIAGTYKHLLVVWEQVYQNAFNGWFRVRLNSNTGASYNYAGVRYRNDTAYPGQNWEEDQSGFGSDNTFAPIMATDTSNSAGNNSYGRMWIYDYAQSSTGIGVEWSSHSKNAADGFNNMSLATGYWQPATLAAVTQIDFVRSSTQTLTGTFKLYGVS
jgi:hypothetical protein